MADTTWYVSTTKGAYRVTTREGEYTPAELGLRESGGMRAAILVDHSRPSRLYAGTVRAGIFRSDDAGETWQEINQGLTYKDVWSLAQHPATGTLYAGTSPAGVFRSQDGGDSWAPCEALWRLPSTRQWHGPVAPFISRLKDIGLSAEDPGLVYGAIEEGWVLRSRDGGDTWEQIQQGVPHDSHCVRAIPGQNSTVVVTGNEGVYRSEDGGETWAESNAGLNGRGYTPAPIVVRKERPDVLFTAVAAVPPPEWVRPEGGDCAFCRSDDGGRSWKVLTGGLPKPLAAIPRGLAADPVNPRGYVAGLTDGSIWVTADDGESFTRALEGLPPILGVTAVCA